MLIIVKENYIHDVLANATIAAVSKYNEPGIFKQLIFINTNINFIKLFKLENMKYYNLFTLILLTLLSACEDEKPTSEQKTYINMPPIPQSKPNQFMVAYSGSYMVNVKGVKSNNDAEGYALSSDGTAKWMWIINDPKEAAKIDSEKTGTWTAEEGKIIISISGNSGMITETWLFQRDGVFRDADIPERYYKTRNN